ncbi:response regulator transcription factor [Olsenella urininfantis]|uniref:response regulator transcription factor n=1 Tax=Olsenella urininfantis TaxID=1871033 RepID=UPI0009867DCC|nr:response regulator transcription factor [Olsenella urininfantis]
MKILVVEDERDLLESIGEGLELDGYYVDLCDNGTDALAAAEVEPYDLILLDLNLPGMDGLDVLSALRGQLSQSKVLVLSARSSISERVAGLDAGADDYLVKPFAFEELEARVRGLLRREYRQGGSVILRGDLSFDTVSRTLRAKGDPIALTKKETAIVEYLLRNSERAVSSEELLEHAWDSNVDLFSNSVRVHIHALRKKLGARLGYDPIGNRVGEGYFLREGEES